MAGEAYWQCRRARKIEYDLSADSPAIGAGDDEIGLQPTVHRHPDRIRAGPSAFPNVIVIAMISAQDVARMRLPTSPVITSICAAHQVDQINVPTNVPVSETAGDGPR
jgi:hypothetical protein